MLIIFINAKVAFFDKIDLRNDMTLKELRKQKNITQKACASYLGVPLRTYQMYEADDSRSSSIKYDYMMQKLAEYGFIDESHGILNIQQIIKTCEEILKDYDVDYCYLFGSYAKGNATESSDVDLLISSHVTGIDFYEMIELLRDSLKKNVDVLNSEQLAGNPELVNEVLKTGIKIYG